MRKSPALFRALATTIFLSSFCLAQSDLGQSDFSQSKLRENATKPASAKIQLSFFGADFLLTGLVWPGTDGQGQIATLGGLRLWDDNVKWGQINTAHNTFDWTLLDNWIAM